jgi:hypothetical protein
MPEARFDTKVSLFQGQLLLRFLMMPNPIPTV